MPRYALLFRIPPASPSALPPNKCNQVAFAIKLCLNRGMKTSADSRLSTMEAAIRATGARVTSSRVRVLGLLQAAGEPLSHGDIAELLNKHALPNIDRVTLYRILDWFASVGLAHKAADSRGVFRFSAANPDGKHTHHAHLRCTGCGGVFCLDLPPPSPPKLPRGFRLSGIALDIRGECPSCAHSH